MLEKGRREIYEKVIEFLYQRIGEFFLRAYIIPVTRGLDVKRNSEHAALLEQRVFTIDNETCWLRDRILNPQPQNFDNLIVCIAISPAAAAAATKVSQRGVLYISDRAN